MSAKVETVELFEAICPECHMGGGPYIWFDDAEEWAATHNAERHETDISDDEAYEKFKESRGK